MYKIGPRSGAVLAALRERIAALGPGGKLPAHTALAEEYGVAPLTIRHVLSELEREGLVSREHGRGTFAREPIRPIVLIVEDDRDHADMLRRHVEQAGHRALVAAGPTEAIEALEKEKHVRLVLSDVRMPAAGDGTGFIRQVRRRWPHVPVAAVTGYPGDLADLFGTPEFPLMVLPKPFRGQQLDELLGLAVGKGPVALTA